MSDEINNNIHRREFCRLVIGGTGLPLTTPTVGANNVTNRLMYKGDPQNTGAIPSVSKRISDISLDWEFNTEYTISWLTNMTIDGGKVYITGKNRSSEPYVGKVYAINSSTGELVWEYETDNWIHTTATLYEDLVIFGNNGSGEDRGLYALDREDGTERWEKRLNTELMGSLTITDDIAYQSTIGGQLLAFNPTNGNTLWTVEMRNGSWGTPAVKDNSIYITGDTNHSNDAVESGQIDGSTVQCFDSETGEEEWVASPTDGRIPSSPVVEENRIYVGSRDGKLYALDRSDGSNLWDLDVNNGIGYAPSVLDGSVFLGGSETLYAIHSETGEIQWESKGEASFRQPVPTLGGVYAGDTNGNIYSFNLAEGTKTQIASIANAKNFANIGNIGSDSIYVYTGGKILKYSIDEHSSSNNNEDARFIFQRYSDATNSLAIQSLLAGGGLIGAYVISKRLLSNNQSKPEQDSGKGDTTRENTGFKETTFHGDRASADTSISSYGQVEMGETIEQSKKYKIIEGKINAQNVWVLSYPTANDETIPTSHLEAFSNTIEAWAKIEDHASLLNVYEYGMEPYPWAAVHPGDHPDISKQLDTLSVKQKIDAVTQVCEAVHHVSRYGIKYKNLTMDSLLTTDEANVVLRGLPDQFGEEDPRYAAPEEQGGEYTERSVIYRLGLITYEVFNGGDLPDNIVTTDSQPKENNIANRGEYSLPDETRDKLTTVLDRAVSSSPEDRYETVLHFRDALQDIT